MNEQQEDIVHDARPSSSTSSMNNNNVKKNNANISSNNNNEKPRKNNRKRSKNNKNCDNGGGGGAINNNRKLSHTLSWALRHSAIDIGLPLLDDGYVPVQEILDSTHPRLKGVTSIENIRNVVETSDKQRFKLFERPRYLFYPNDANENNDESNDTTVVKTILCIRANQGHSIKLISPEKLLTKLTTDELRALPCIVHGTYLEAWESIKKEQNEGGGGLKKMKRTHIHFASGLPDEKGVISGMRKNCNTYIYIDAIKCAATTSTDGGRIDFFTSDNGVLLTDGIDNTGILPIEYFSHVTDTSGKILLDNRDRDTDDDNVKKNNS
jgi:RNA:NAD 2'-phosphotransferase (TPT1/KptA family)